MNTSIQKKFKKIIIQLNLLHKHFLVFPSFSGLALISPVLLWSLELDGFSMAAQAVQQVLIIPSMINAMLMLILLPPSSFLLSTWGHFYMFASTLSHLDVSSPVCKFTLHLILLCSMPFMYVRCYLPFRFVTCSSLTEHWSIVGTAVPGSAPFSTVPCLCSSAPRLHFSKPLLSYQACIPLCIPLHQSHKYPILRKVTSCYDFV